MNKKVLSLIILILTGWMVANAQDEGKITIQGSVTDGKTGEPVAFANIGLLGTVAGVASDVDGNYTLTVPDKYATHVLRVSAVGYAPFEIKVYEAKDRSKIQLRPVTYGIGAVDVYGQLLVYKKMLQNVVSNIGKNYIPVPYNYEGYFKYTVSVNGAEKTKEAIVNIYDSEGYHRSDVASTFRELNYTFNQVRRSEGAASVWDKLTYFDDILTADIVRNPRNVLDIQNARDYKLKSKGKLLYEGDSVQVIAYEAPAPSLSTTGDASVTRYNGEIYINQKDFGVLKNVTHITSKDFSILGRNLMPIGETSKGEVKMTITTTYKKLRSVYFLSGVEIRYEYNQGAEEVKGEMQYLTTRVNLKTPTPVEGRLYYENLKANENFWNRYSAYFEGEE